jgi:hypothetical protein
MNQELCWYLKEHHNRRDHRRLPLSKEEAWLTVKGVVDIELPAWEHIFHRAFRTLDAGGCFDFRGEGFKVKGIPYPGGVRVQVYLGVQDGAVLVADPRDGQKYPAAPFAIPPAGEYHIGARTPLEVLQRERAEEKKGTGWKPALPVTFAPGAGGNVVYLVRQAEVRESSFEMPAAQAGKPAPPESLEDLAAGVRMIERIAGGDTCATEEPLAPTLDQYTALQIKKAKGEPLSEREAAFLPWFEEACAGLLKDFGADVEMRVRLALVG